VKQETVRGLREQAARIAKIAETNPAYSGIAQTAAEAADRALKQFREQNE
jgi:hypothetical protein